MARNWSLTLSPASLGGAPFHVRSNEREVGRRHADHTIPNGGHVVEEFGAKTNRFDVEAYCVGDAADVLAAALLDVAESEGPHLLTLPTVSAMVTVDSARSTFERDSLGRIMVRISAIDAGLVSAPGFGASAGFGVGLAALDDLVFDAADVLFDTLADMGGALVSALGLSTSTAASALVDGLVGNALVGLATLETVRDLILPSALLSIGLEAIADLDGLPSEVGAARDLAIAAAAADFDDLASEIAAAAETVSLLVSSPSDWSAEVVAPIRSLGDLADPDLWPRQAARLLDLTAQAGPIAYVTPVTTAAAASAAIVPALVRTAAVASVIEGSVRRTYADRTSAVAARNRVVDLAQSEIARLGVLSPVPGRTISALAALRDAAVTALVRRSTTLAPVMTIDSTRVRPALAWAWDLYGDPTRAVEIVARNRLDHASFVPTRFEALAR